MKTITVDKSQHDLIVGGIKKQHDGLFEYFCGYEWVEREVINGELDNDPYYRKQAKLIEETLEVIGSSIYKLGGIAIDEYIRNETLEKERFNQYQLPQILWEDYLAEEELRPRINNDDDDYLTDLDLEEALNQALSVNPG